MPPHGYRPLSNPVMSVTPPLLCPLHKMLKFVPKEALINKSEIIREGVESAHIIDHDRRSFTYMFYKKHEAEVRYKLRNI